MSKRYAVASTMRRMSGATDNGRRRTASPALIETAFEDGRARPGHRRPRRMLTRLACVAVLAAGVGVGIAGCGGASTASGSSKPSLTVAVGANIAEFSQVFVAQEAGLYKKYGVNVSLLTNAGSTINTYLVSGKADLMLYTGANSLILAAKNVDVQNVYGSLLLELSALIGAPNIKTLSAAEHLQNCKIATLTPGSSVYANAIYLKTRLGLHCTITSLSSIPLITSAVDSGHYQLGVVATSTAVTQQQTTGINLLLNPYSPAAQKYKPAPVLLSTFAGIKSDLQAKSTAVTRFLEAITAASELIQKSSSASVAKLLSKSPAFAGVPMKTLTQDVIYAKPYLTQGTNPGYISEAFWNKAVKTYGDWGIAGFKANDPGNAYDLRVDMTYNNRAVAAMK